MVRSTLTLLALFNVAILFPGKAMSQNSEGREFREPVPFRMCLSDTILM